MHHYSKIYLLPLALITSALIIWGCSKDDDDEGGGSSANVNANATRMYPEAGRIEIPKLKEGVVNMFLVKRVQNFGINFCLEWDISKKAQRWVAFRWDKSYQDDDIGRTEAWAEDFDIPEFYRTNQSFYSGSGYTRGHMVASEDRQQLPLDNNRQTFLYSNMHPQYWNFNGGIWLTLENKIRTWNNDAFRDTLYVVKGGTIDHSSDIIETTYSGLIVPKYFFMAILCKNRSSINKGYKSIGFFLEHKKPAYADESNVSPYIVSIERLEELTGIDFFCNLPDDIEEQVERNVTPTAWGFQ